MECHGAAMGLAGTPLRLGFFRLGAVWNGPRKGGPHKSVTVTSLMMLANAVFKKCLIV